MVRIGVRADGSRISLTIEDSRPGIPGAVRPRLFDRFHRVTGQGSGAGLGLAIGDSIVRSTGGRWHIGDSSLVRDVPARVTKFGDPLLDQSIALARIIFGLLHLLDQVSELSAAHLLRHVPRVSRFGFSQTHK